MNRICFLFTLLLSADLVAIDFDGSWADDDIQIYKTVGNRGQDIFTSNICTSTSYVPQLQSNSNRYVSADFILDFNSDRSILVISGKDRCLPNGIYTKID